VDGSLGLFCFVFSKEKCCVSFIIILSLVLNGAVLKAGPIKRTLIFLKNFCSHDNFFSFSI